MKNDIPIIQISVNKKEGSHEMKPYTEKPIYESEEIFTENATSKIIGYLSYLEYGKIMITPLLNESMTKIYYRISPYSEYEMPEKCEIRIGDLYMDFEINRDKDKIESIINYREYSLHKNEIIENNKIHWDFTKYNKIKLCRSDNTKESKSLKKNEIIIPFSIKHLSSRHAKIIYKPLEKKFMIKDLFSLNGTYINVGKNSQNININRFCEILIENKKTGLEIFAKIYQPSIFPIAKILQNTVEETIEKSLGKHAIYSAIREDNNKKLFDENNIKDTENSLCKIIDLNEVFTKQILETNYKSKFNISDIICSHLSKSSEFFQFSQDKNSKFQINAVISSAFLLEKVIQLFNNLLLGRTKFIRNYPIEIHNFLSIKNYNENSVIQHKQNIFTEFIKNVLNFKYCPSQFATEIECVFNEKILSPIRAKGLKNFLQGELEEGSEKYNAYVPNYQAFWNFISTDLIWSIQIYPNNFEYEYNKIYKCAQIKYPDRIIKPNKKIQLATFKEKPEELKILKLQLLKIIKNEYENIEFTTYIQENKFSSYEQILKYYLLTINSEKISNQADIKNFYFEYIKPLEDFLKLFYIKKPETPLYEWFNKNSKKIAFTTELEYKFLSEILCFDNMLSKLEENFNPRIIQEYLMKLCRFTIENSYSTRSKIDNLPEIKSVNKEDPNIKIVTKKKQILRNSHNLLLFTTYKIIEICLSFFGIQLK